MGKKDMIFGGSLFLICVLLIIETFNFYSPPNQIAGPSLWPRIILTLLAALSLVLVYSGFRKLQAERGQASQEVKEPFLNPKTKRVMAAIVSTIGFLVAFRTLGFAISVIIYFVIITYILEPLKGAKPLLIRIGQAVLLVAFIYFVFGKGLSVRLPNGILPNSWFI